MKPIDELEFTDDYMFGAVLRDEELCKGVLERLLRIDIERIEYPELQKAIKVGYEVHGIRLDVYVRNSDTVFDLEIQNSNYEDLGRRTRFYQSIIDADNLLKGKHYSELPASKIIFICKTDPFKDGKQCYCFENRCIEIPDLLLNDKTQKLIYNASGYADEPDMKLRSFMHFVSTNEATDSFTEQLYKRVEVVKQQEKFRTEYLKMYIGMEDEKRRAVKEAVKVAVEEAVEKTEEDTVKKMLKEGIAVEVVVRCVNLPVERIQELAKEL